MTDFTFYRPSLRLGCFLTCSIPSILWGRNQGSEMRMALVKVTSLCPPDYSIFFFHIGGTISCHLMPHPGQFGTNSLFIYALSPPSFSKSGSFSDFLKECTSHSSQLSRSVTISVRVSWQAREYFCTQQSPVVRKSWWKLMLISCCGVSSVTSQGELFYTSFYQSN